MNQKEKRNLETQLVKMGLAGLDSQGNETPQLIQQIAAIVNHWHPVENKWGEWVDKHLYLRDLLNECDGDKRQQMYDDLVPKLNFKAKPLADYETMITIKAGKMVSQRRMRVEGNAPPPIEINGHAVQITDAKNSDCGWAILRCHACDKVKKFLGDTPVDAITKARKDGWVRNVTLQEETCPECAAKQAAGEMVVLSRHEALIVTDKRRVN